MSFVRTPKGMFTDFIQTLRILHMSSAVLGRVGFFVCFVLFFGQGHSFTVNLKFHFTLKVKLL